MSTDPASGVERAGLTCVRCGCLCDDLTASVPGDQPADLTLVPHCSLGQSWLREELAASPGVRHHVAGEPVALPEAMDAASRALRGAKHPLFLVSGATTLEESQAICRLAETVRASLLPMGSALGHAWTETIQECGISTATLGELRDRGDLVVLWRCDPDTSHPRFRERFLDQPVGSGCRRLVRVRDPSHVTAAEGEVSLPLPAALDFAALGLLRLLVQGKSAAAADAETVSPALPFGALVELFEQLRNARLAAFVVDGALVSGPLAGRPLAELARLAADLHATTRCVVVPLGPPRSFDAVVSWQTGRTAPVRFTDDGPLSWRPKSLADAVAESDLLVRFGGASGRSPMPEATVDLRPVGQASQGVAVDIVVGRPGVDEEGSLLRMDEIPLPVPAIRPREAARLAEVCEQLATRLAQE